MINIKKKLESGISLPMTIVFAFACSGVMFSYIMTMYDKDFDVEYRLTEAQAIYNADAAIALEVYPRIFRKDYIFNPGLDTLSDVSLGDMGSFSVGWHELIDKETAQRVRVAYATGKSKLKHILGKKEIEITKTRQLTLGQAGLLSEFLYLTDKETAGGAPWSFNAGIPSATTRRPVTFGNNDTINPEWPPSEEDAFCDVAMQSNDQIVLSQWGAPTFNITLNVTRDPDGTIHFPNVGSHNIDEVFTGEPQFDTLACINLPPKGYYANKKLIERDPRHVTLDATNLLKWNANFTSRDTLIMTDIEFYVDSAEDFGFRVKQWWFLQPPYFRDAGFGEMPFIYPNSLNYNMLLGNTDALSDYNLEVCNNPIACQDCWVGSQIDIKGCWTYIQQLQQFHSKTINTATGNDAFVDPWGIVSGAYGFHSYDFPEIYKEYDIIELGNDLNNITWVSQFNGYPNETGNSDIPVSYVDDLPPSGKEDHLLREYLAFGGAKEYQYRYPIAIYVKGGPVRVHGVFKGKYTIYTDEHTAYRRHAHALNTMGDNPIDTLWNNIWIIDDLVNIDASGHSYQHPATNQFLNNPKSMYYMQPSESNPGTDNVLGLVSGANVYVANTSKNGARNCDGAGGDDNDPHDECHININANIVAFNESFAVQYWQNTYTRQQNPADFYSNPPYGDGQGIEIFGGNSGGDDNRGIINLWGGVVQDQRGYVVRNSPGPYIDGLAGDIGFPNKNYNYDCNVKKAGNQPPLFPEIERCDEGSIEDVWYVTSYY